MAVARRSGGPKAGPLRITVGVYRWRPRYRSHGLGCARAPINRRHLHQPCQTTTLDRRRSTTLTRKRWGID
uniref:Uncharacterized protein n=1 Tax=Oryza sativa subsp. japonica TaxID=39947 RepID=Q6EPZ5_ORYSJ|nr:hypothetical protein [Oryza sativa Japonica Group]